MLTISRRAIILTAALVLGVGLLLLAYAMKVRDSNSNVAGPASAPAVVATSPASTPATAAKVVMDEEVNELLGEIRQRAVDESIGGGRAASAPRDQAIGATITELLEQPGGELELASMIAKATAGDRQLILAVLRKHYSEEVNPILRGKVLGGLSVLADAATMEQAMLNDENEGIRRFAAYLLGSHVTEQHIPSLLEAVRRDEGELGRGRPVAAAAIRTLGRVGGAQASAALIGVWKDKKLSDGCEADIVSALGLTGDPAMFDILDTVFRGKNTSLQGTALGAIGDLARKNVGNEIVRDRAMSIFIECMASESPRIRAKALSGIEGIGSEQDIDRLRPLLDDPYSTTVSYIQDGQKKAKQKYPVREAASQAIRVIKTRSASSKDK